MMSVQDLILNANLLTYYEIRMIQAIKLLLIHILRCQFCRQSLCRCSKCHGEVKLVNSRNTINTNIVVMLYYYLQKHTNIRCCDYCQ